LILLELYAIISLYLLVKEDILEDNTNNSIVVTKKVVLSEDNYRKLKAIGVLYENELDETKEPNLIGKGIEKIMLEFKKNKTIENLF
jgi:hypothetical protein